METIRRAVVRRLDARTALMCLAILALNLLAVGAAVFQEPHFKLAQSIIPEELLWILGERGVRDYRRVGHPGDENRGSPSDSKDHPKTSLLIKNCKTNPRSH